MLARRSSVSLSPGCHTGSFCILFHVFLFRRESGNLRRQLTHTRPLPQSHIASTTSHFRERLWRGDDWLLIVSDEFSITFTLILQLLPPITLCYPCAHFPFFCLFLLLSPLGLFVFTRFTFVPSVTADFTPLDD